MDARKSINVGISSSLIDLKAELLRKQAELKSTRSRDSRGGAVKTTKKSDILSAKSKDARSNKGIEVRSQKDRLRIAEEEKSLEKSRNVLEAKAQLYDKMQKAALILDNVDDDYDEDSAVNPLFANSLVNFQQKAVEEIEERRRNLELERKRKIIEKVEEEEDDDVVPGPYPVDEEEWTEFTDALGRTRKCLKTDISSYLERDEKLSRPENPGISLSAVADDRRREMKREKWEIEAELLAARDKVHYQDILFDEVRTHGAGYYAFSKDEATRAQQMKDLKKLSEQTAANRKKIKKEKTEKKSALKERLKKIRNKKRAKQGLPPLPDSSEEEEEEEENGDEEETLEKDGKQPSAEIRAWDVGKAGVFGPRPTTFDELDEKWLRDRRSDRNQEFAPPTSIYSEGGLRKQYNNQKQPDTSFSAFGRDKYQNFVKSKESLPSTSTTTTRANTPPPPVVVEPQPKPFRPPDNFWKQRTASSSRPPPQKPVPIEDETPAPIPESSEEFDRGRGTEIAPPPTFEYYHGESRPKPQRAPLGQSDAYVKDAVSTGLKALREQFESKKRGSDSTSTEKQFPDFL